MEFRGAGAASFSDIRKEATLSVTQFPHLGNDGDVP